MRAIRRCLEEVVACLKRKYAEAGEERDDGEGQRKVRRKERRARS